MDARFASFVNVDKLPAPYAAADLLVHPVIGSEGACIGLPMLLSDRVGAVGPTDITRPGDIGLIFPCAHATALGGMIDTLSGDDARRATMSARSLKIFDELDIKASVTDAHRGIETAHAAP